MAKSLSTQIELQEIKAPLARLRPGPWQNRTHFDPVKMAELIESIRESGIINPPIVQANNGHYDLIAGERRWRASCALTLEAFDGLELAQAIRLVCREDAPAQIAARPLLKQITITVRLAAGEAEAERLHVAGIVDNEQREDLDPVERAKGYLSLKTAYGWSVHRIARQVGKSDLYVSNHLSLLELEEEIQALIAGGKLSKDARAVKALLAIPDREARVKLASRLADRRASIKTIQVAARKVAAVFERNEALSRGTVAVAEARVISRPAPVVVPAGSHLCLCPACAETIQHLAEELCDGCRETGLAEGCRDCPGLIEFVEKLVRYTRPEVA